MLHPLGSREYHTSPSALESRGNDEMDWHQLSLALEPAEAMSLPEFLSLTHCDIVRLCYSCTDESGIHKDPMVSTRLPGFTTTQETLADIAIRLCEFCVSNDISPEEARSKSQAPLYVGNANRAQMAVVCTNLHSDVAHIGVALRYGVLVRPLVGTLIHRIEQTANRIDALPHPEMLAPRHWWLWHCVHATLSRRES